MPKLNDHTSLGGVNRGFPTTEWTRIIDTTQRGAILAELCQKYWKPLYSYLRCKGFPNDEAKDLVQGFFTDKVLGQEFVDKADRARGKFRTFLLVALRNYTINILKSDKLRQNHDPGAGESVEDTGPETEFNRVWAEELLQEVLKQLEQECYRRGKRIHWLVFREWLLEPKTDSDKARMNDICAKYDIASPSKAYNMISNIKSRFRVHLRDHLRLTVETDAEVDSEIISFMETVARLQSILFGRHLLLGAKSWQKPNLMFGSAGTETWKVLLVKLDVV